MSMKSIQLIGKHHGRPFILTHITDAKGQVACLNLVGVLEWFDIEDLSDVQYREIDFTRPLTGQILP